MGKHDKFYDVLLGAKSDLELHSLAAGMLFDVMGTALGAFDDPLCGTVILQGCRQGEHAPQAALRASYCSGIAYADANQYFEQTNVVATEASADMRTLRLNEAKGYVVQNPAVCTLFSRGIYHSFCLGAGDDCYVASACVTRSRARSDMSDAAAIFMLTGLALGLKTLCPAEPEIADGVSQIIKLAKISSQILGDRRPGLEEYVAALDKVQTVLRHEYQEFQGDWEQHYADRSASGYALPFLKGRVVRQS